MTQQTSSNIKDAAFEVWFRKNYLYIIMGFVLIYTALPVAAPIFMKFNLIFAAKMIYWMYSFFCHQYPFRSWFLFGSQPFYPLAEADISGVKSFEAMFNFPLMDNDAMRVIIGNDITGYKMAFCQRDFALYSSLFIFSLIFLFSKRLINRIPLWAWLIFGVIPLGLDGLTQYLGTIIDLPFTSLMRESTPLLRSITGSMFGFLSGWFIFPSLESAIKNKNFERKTA